MMTAQAGAVKNISYTGIIAGLIAAVIALSAFVRIPMYPVPFTMQNYVIILMPMVFGARRSFYGVLIYITLGITGLPIFASGGGLGYVFKPTFGYVLGYLISTIPVGMIASRFNNIMGYLLAGIVSVLIVDGLGALWLYGNLNLVQDKATSLHAAFMMGVAPFILFDFVKMIGAVMSVPMLRKVVRNSNLV